MCKPTKNLPIHGYPGRLLDFQNSEGRILQRGKGKIPGVEMYHQYFKDFTVMARFTPLISRYLVRLNIEMFTYCR